MDGSQYCLKAVKSVETGDAERSRRISDSSLTAKTLYKGKISNCVAEANFPLFFLGFQLSIENLASFLAPLCS
jgi:hypothetical protein